MLGTITVSNPPVHLTSMATSVWEHFPNFAPAVDPSAQSYKVSQRGWEGAIYISSWHAGWIAPLSLAAIVCIVRGVPASGLLDFILDLLHGDCLCLLTRLLHNPQRSSTLLRQCIPRLRCWRGGKSMFLP